MSKNLLVDVFSKHPSLKELLAISSFISPQKKLNLCAKSIILLQWFSAICPFLYRIWITSGGNWLWGQDDPLKIINVFFPTVLSGFSFINFLISLYILPFIIHISISEVSMNKNALMFISASFIFSSSFW